MRHFNVTLIHPQTYVHAAALSEAADYLCACLQACGLSATRTTNSIVRNAVNVLLGGHLLSADHARKVPANSIIFNNECLSGQLDRPDENPAYHALLRRHFVWDHSASNLELIPHGRKALVEFGYAAALRSTLPRTPTTGLLFYGAITAWRKRILDELVRRGLHVRTLFGAYGDSRDREMMRAWAVLNLHRDCNEEVRFETLRCFYPLINRVPVISEPASDAHAAGFTGSIFFIPADRLADEIHRLMRTPEDFVGASESMFQRFQQRSGTAAMHAAIEQYLVRSAAAS